MATTGIITADLMRVYVDGTAIGCATNVSLDLSVDTKDIVCQDTDRWAKFKSGKRTWTISASAYYALDGSGKKFADVFALYLSGAEVTVKIGSTGSGDTAYEGDAILTAAKINASGEGDPVTWDATFTGVTALAVAA